MYLYPSIKFIWHPYRQDQEMKLVQEIHQVYSNLIFERKKENVLKFPILLLFFLKLQQVLIIYNVGSSKHQLMFSRLHLSKPLIIFS